MATTNEGLFPLFRAKFFGAAACKASEHWLGNVDAMDVTAGGVDQGETPSSAHRPNLKTLDLKALPREDGPVSETQLRRQKYQFFEKQCSRIVDGLFLAGDQVARSREILEQNGVTHVLNCVGFICKEYFKDQGLRYKTYYLQDTPGEDILSVLYDALEFIDDSLKSGGKVLVHCSQGVSRSATLVIAYLMWKTGNSYDEVFAQVKEARGVANPNIGFTCQLLQWQKRRQLQAPARMRLYRITPHCPQSPLTLVAKSVPYPKLQYPNNTYRDLDRRGAFVVHASDRIFTWIGSACPPAFAAAARYHAKLLLKYEHMQLLQQRQGRQDPAILEVHQGSEPPEFVSLMDPQLLDGEAARLNARRTSIAEELATGSTACLPADGTDPLGSESSSMFIGTVPEVRMASGGSSSSSGSGAAAASMPGPGGAAAAAAAAQGGPAFQQHAAGSSLHYARSNLGLQSRPGSSSWAVGEIDEYSDDFEMYYDAVRKCNAESVPGSSGEGMTLPGLRAGRANSAIGPDLALPGAASHLLSTMSGTPESPASAEGRLKKYRRSVDGNASPYRSESEGRAAAAHKAPPRPSLHTSIGDEDMLTL